MNEKGTFFSVPFRWSGGVTAITIVYLILISGAVIFTVSLGDWPSWLVWLKYLLLITFITSVVIPLGFMPLNLTADDGYVVVERLFRPLVIPRNEIIESRRLYRNDLDKSRQSYASGGAFGFLGKFKNPRLGAYTLIATELDSLVLIRTPYKCFVFSCSSPAELVEFLHQG